MPNILLKIFLCLHSLQETHNYINVRFPKDKEFNIILFETRVTSSLKEMYQIEILTVDVSDYNDWFLDMDYIWFLNYVVL